MRISRHAIPYAWACAAGWLACYFPIWFFNLRLAIRSRDNLLPSLPAARAIQQCTSWRTAYYGLWTRVVAQLTLDDAAREHNAKMTQLTWAIAEENAQHKLRVLQEENQRQIMADRIAVYRQIVAAGDTEAFAMQLALHPADITAIAKILKDEELSKRRETVNFVAHMVNSGVVERWEVSDQAREALQWLKDATARVIHERKQQGDPEVRQGRSDLWVPEPRPRHATRRYSLISPPTRASFRTRYWARSTGSGSGFIGAAACRERCGRCWL